jgi:hypothetical protein
VRGAIPPLPHYVFMALCFVKHRDNFTFRGYIFMAWYLVKPTDSFTLPCLMGVLSYVAKITTHFQKMFNVLITVGPNGRGIYVWGACGTGPLEHWYRGFESRSRHGYMCAFFCVVLSCVDRGLAVGRSPVQGVLPKCLKEFIVSEVNSALEQAREPNPETYIDDCSLYF